VRSAAAARRARSVMVMMLGASVFVGCTVGGTADPPPAVTSSPDPIEVGALRFDRVCITVPPFMLDVALGARWGGAKVRAIAAVPAVHAVAVMSPDPDDCGEWSLALRTDLSPSVRTGIENELRAAASLPPDPLK
jgi:hypothetical protein